MSWRMAVSAICVPFQTTKFFWSDLYMAIALPITNLMSVLTPQQFRTAILVTIGLKNSEIAEFLGTTEHVVKNILKVIYDRAGCWNRVELALRFVCESESRMYDQNKIKNEIAELETRATQILHSVRGKL
jgi:DNA-binding CsgD family transcriptional regulator